MASCLELAENKRNAKLLKTKDFNATKDRTCSVCMDDFLFPRLITFKSACFQG